MEHKYDMDQILENYAEIIVKVGLNLQPEQRLFITASPLETAPLVRKVVEAAYKNGSKLVSVTWRDEELSKVRFQHAPKDSFEEYPTWESDGALISAERNDAFLYIIGNNPELLKEQDPSLVAIAQKTAAKLLEPVNMIRGANKVQWLIVCPPTPSWASKVFPNDTQEDAEMKLWDAVIKACRLNVEDPVKFWKGQAENLGKRKKYLTHKKYASLRIYGPGTDLSLGLPAGHKWEGGSPITETGVHFIPNLPTEEVFTSPHRLLTNGTVSSTKPLSSRGKLIDNFNITFSKGKVTSFSAEKGEAVLKELLATDENANFLGEVALVPHKSPISQLGLVFLNTLYDENASSHLALGRSFRFCMEGGGGMSDEEYAEAGGNKSLIHVDFMIGSEEISVDGILADGKTEAIMRDGEWAFDI